MAALFVGECFPLYRVFRKTKAGGKMDRIFGTVIRKIREKKHLSQSDAARFSGLSQSEWSRLEDGMSWPRKRTIVVLCKALDVTAKEFFMSIAAHIQGLEPAAWNEWGCDDDKR